MSPCSLLGSTDLGVWNRFLRNIHSDKKNSSNFRKKNSPSKSLFYKKKILLWAYFIKKKDSPSEPIFIYKKNSLFGANCKSLPFFYFLTFEKADCSIFALLVGWLVGRSTSPLILFNIYRHKSPLLTHYHSIPISTKLYWPNITKLQPISPHTDSTAL